MTVEHIEVLVEEPSMEAFLGGVLPKLLPTASFRIYSHQGKPDLLSKLPSRLRAYSRWLPETSRILVVTDRDRDECAELKAQLNDASQAVDAAGERRVLNRIAIQELEAWHFGDWQAVRAAYPRVPATIPRQARYRDPDEIDGTWEAFESVLQGAGYFAGGLRKIEAARAISIHIEPSRNTSPSFRSLREGLATWVR